MSSLSEVLAKPYDWISSSEFIKITENYDLELIEESYSCYYFKVSNSISGFESLEIANELYESDIVEYSHPNFIAPLAHH